MSIMEDLINELDIETTLQTSRRYVGDIEGNITKTIRKMILFIDIKTIICCLQI